MVLQIRIYGSNRPCIDPSDLMIMSSESDWDQLAGWYHLTRYLINVAIYQCHYKGKNVTTVSRGRKLLLPYATHTCFTVPLWASSLSLLLLFVMSVPLKLDYLSSLCSSKTTNSKEKSYLISWSRIWKRLVVFLQPFPWLPDCQCTVDVPLSPHGGASTWGSLPIEADQWRGRKHHKTLS